VFPPLHGIRVVDLSELMPGPYATKLLADLGADVLKIERPGGDGAHAVSEWLYNSLNHGKALLTLDLRSEAGQAKLAELVVDADIVVESYRPGVTARLGADYPRLSQINERIIYASLTGYGQYGPDAARPGHDINFLAASGALAISGPPDGGPSHDIGLPVGDLAGSMFAVTSILAALVQRAATGKGQFLDVSITDSVLSWMTPRLGYFHGKAALGVEQGRFEILSRPAYGLFATADDRHLTIAAIEDKFWSALVKLLGLSFDNDERCRSYPGRKPLAPAINAEIAQRIATRSLSDWLPVFAATDIPYSAVLRPDELFDDPHHLQRGVVSNRQGDPVTIFPVPMLGMNAG
jgi:CoA:oxalate CoA-transferase